MVFWVGAMKGKRVSAEKPAEMLKDSKIDVDSTSLEKAVEQYKKVKAMEKKRVRLLEKTRMPLAGGYEALEELSGKEIGRGAA
jgi:hypothetical protein